jgi:uncharacterized protein (DUF924 family)
MATPEELIAFWREAGPAKWFARDEAFDAEFRQRFESAHFAAARAEYEPWMASGEGALALQILLDQFPRNCFRGTAHSYATDGLALHYAQRAVDAGLDRDVEAPLRVFCYLAFEHSESLPHQDQAVSLIARLGDAELSRYAELHRDVIQRFGRFPHRNAALGRESTQEEAHYLASGGFSA